MRARAACFFALLLAACSSKDSELTCVTNLDLSCAPLYAPTFDNVFTRTMKPTCAQPGGACHAAAGAQNGLVLENEGAAYALLLGKTDGRARVLPGNAACSLVTEHLESTDASQVMPPGGQLQQAERCAIEQWIQNGAKR